MLLVGNYTARSDFLDDLQSAIRSASGDALRRKWDLTTIHALSLVVPLNEHGRDFVLERLVFPPKSPTNPLR